MAAYSYSFRVWAQWPLRTIENGSIQLRDRTTVHDGDTVELGGGSVELVSSQSLIEPDSLTADARACVAFTTDPTKVFLVGENQDGTVGVKVVESSPSTTSTP